MLRPHRTALSVALLALAGAVWIGEDAREPRGPLPVDRRVLHDAVEHRTVLVVRLAQTLSHLGDPVVLILLAVVVTVLLWRKHGRALPTLLPTAALVMASIIEASAKQLIGRPRPPVMYHLLVESDASFPSGHATGSAAFYLALALVISPTLRHRLARMSVVVAAATLAALVGWSRVVLGVHWVTDIAAGWLLGVAVAVAVAAGPVAAAGTAMVDRTFDRTPVRLVRGLPAGFLGRGPAASESGISRRRNR